MIYLAILKSLGLLVHLISNTIICFLHLNRHFIESFNIEFNDIVNLTCYNSLLKVP